MSKEAEYRRLFLECAIRKYAGAKEPAIAEDALHTADRLVDALRTYNDMQAMFGRRKHRNFDSASASRLAALPYLKAAGPTFAECLEFFGKRREENRYARGARDVFAKNSDGLIEVDDKTVVVSSDKGAFILQCRHYPLALAAKGIGLRSKASTQSETAL